MGEELREFLSANSICRHDGSYLFALAHLPGVILLLQDNGYRIQSVELFDKAQTERGVEYLATGKSARVEGAIPFSAEMAEKFVAYLSETFGAGFAIRLNTNPSLSEQPASV